MAHMLQTLFIPRVFVSCSVPETVQDTHDGRVITPLREFANQVNHLARVDSDLEQEFVRCALLSTAQWALDSREDIPPAHEVRARFMVVVREMVDSLHSDT